MEGGYAVWMGQPVVLRVVTGNLRVPLRGRLMSETNEWSGCASRIAGMWTSSNPWSSPSNTITRFTSSIRKGKHERI